VTTRRNSSKSESRTFVLDTSVLLADPAAFLRFAEHEVIIPLVVISELEGKPTTRSWATLPASPCACWTSCGSGTGGWMSRYR